MQLAPEPAEPAKHGRSAAERTSSRYQLQETPEGLRIEWGSATESSGPESLGALLPYLFFVGTFALCTLLTLLMALQNPFYLLLAALCGGFTLILVSPWLTTLSKNRTIIEITSERLTIRHGPLPFGKNWDLYAPALVDLRVEKRTVSHYGRFSPPGGYKRTRHELIARDRQGQSYALFDDLEKWECEQLKGGLENALARTRRGPDAEPGAE
jgi:hypothetical protein